ncbi:hypothetical protein B0T22DRAFT_494309 [Podospora appendiculata]|uniref:Uncharacterized protein n=1 Tax=Podospora appendiculata TaxID=314037 RepID=A0AAE1C8B8_9PEZI|nr:hypothetical protein B0T22DRAFT_494309 [Podospora appendiculata]
MASPVTSIPSSPTTTTTTTTTTSIACRIKEEFISQRIQCWTAKRQPMTEGEITTRYATATFVTPKPPGLKPGSLFPSPSGGYVFELECWACDYRNSELLKNIEKLLDEEVEDKCYWEFREGGDVSSLDFRGKYRLLSNPICAGLDHISGGQFKFGVCKVDSYGYITMVWRYLDRKCTLEDMVDKLKDFSRHSSFQPQRVIHRQLKEIDSIMQHLGAATEVVDLKQELLQFQNEAETENKADGLENTKWNFFMCNRETANLGMESRSWKALDGLEGFYTLKREAKASGMRPVFVNPWQLRFYKISQSIESMVEHQHQRYLQHYNPVDPGSEGLANFYSDLDDGGHSTAWGGDVSPDN